MIRASTSVTLFTRMKNATLLAKIEQHLGSKNFLFRKLRGKFVWRLPLRYLPRWARQSPLAIFSLRQLEACCTTLSNSSRACNSNTNGFSSTALILLICGSSYGGCWKRSRVKSGAAPQHCATGSKSWKGQHLIASQKNYFKVSKSHGITIKKYSKQTRNGSEDTYSVL